MFIELRWQIAKSPIGVACPIKRTATKDVAPLELRGRIGFFYKHIARTGLKLIPMGWVLSCSSLILR